MPGDSSPDACRRWLPRGRERRPVEPAADPTPPADLRPRLLGEPVDVLSDPLPEVRRGHRRRITVIGEPVLRTPCRPVTNLGTPETTRLLEGLIDDLFRTMAVAEGVGLAANQIGVDLRVVVYDCPDPWDIRHVGHIVNPVLDPAVTRSAAPASRTEGCLSVPGPVAALDRPGYAVARGVDLHGRPIVLSGYGLFARCLHHEVDHLDGRLYLDRLPGRRRRRVLREMRELQDDVWAHWDDRDEAFSAGQYGD